MSASICDRTLWDYSGNYCRVELHKIGDQSFEVYFHNFNGAVPVRVIGRLGELTARIDPWLARKMYEGFSAPLDLVTAPAKV